MAGTAFSCMSFPVIVLSCQYRENRSPPLRLKEEGKSTPRPAGTSHPCIPVLTCCASGRGHGHLLLLLPSDAERNARILLCYLINAPVASYPIDHVLSPANLLKTSTSVTQGAKKKNSVVSKLQKRLRCRVGELVACKLQGGGTLWKELKNVWQCQLSAPTGAPHVKMPREAIAYSSVLAVTGSAVLQ